MEVMMAMKLSPAFGLFLFMATSPAQPVLTVEGLNGTSVVISADDLAKLPQQTIKTSDHGNRVSFEGVLLKDLLAKVELPAGEKFHKTAASYYMLAEAKDGYRAVFAGRNLIRAL